MSDPSPSEVSDRYVLRLDAPAYGLCAYILRDGELRVEQQRETMGPNATAQFSKHLERLLRMIVAIQERQPWVTEGRKS